MQTTLSGLVAYEYRVGRTSTVVLQLGASESPFHEVELDQLSRVAYLVDVGIKKGWGEHVVLFFAISENVVNFGNSADLGGHLGLTFTW